MKAGLWAAGVFLPLLFAAPVSLWAQEAQDGEAVVNKMAEIQPLATQSLLLDITQTDSGRLVAVGERGHVIVSDDGQEWRQIDGVPTRSTLTTVTTVGDHLWAAGHDTAIITSDDGGDTWTSQYFDPERQQAIMDLYFTDSQNGSAMGAYGLYLRTSDGGNTWEDDLVDSENDYHLNQMIRWGDGRRMIAGEAGFSYRSSDDGQSWEAMDLPYFGSMWGAQSAAQGCAMFFGLRGHILESCDFGDSWTEISVDTLSSLSGSASSGDETIIVGNSGAVLLRDADGGFTVHVHSSGVDFSSVISVGSGQYLLVGEEGVHQFPEPVNNEGES